MASNHVRIHGRGHLLCLSRTLQVCLEEDLFSDVLLSTFSSAGCVNSVQSLRANRAVLAAASPVLGSLLKETLYDDEASLVFVDYSHKDISNLVEYIYTGKVMVSPDSQSFKQLLSDLKIGSMAVETRSPDLPTVEAEVEDVAEIANVIPSSSPLAERPMHTRRNKAIRVFKRATRLTKSDVTLDDPLCSIENVSAKSMSSSWLEKSMTKVDLLSELNRVEGAGSGSSNSVADLPRLADRLGIYFDPQLFNYYRGLIRSLPPIRIFLHIEEDRYSESDTDDESTISKMKQPKIVYPAKAKRISKDCVQRKSYSGSRLPVKTMCSANGKTHLILDGPIPASWTDQSVRAIDYPSVPGDEDEGQVEVATESHRKNVVFSGDSRMKIDHAHSKTATQTKRIPQTPTSTRIEDEDAEDEENENSDEAEVPLSSSLTRPKKPSQRMVVCEICGKLISTSWIRIHFANHQGEKNYLCEHCGRSFASLNLLKSHVHYQHNAQLDLLQCSICSKSFTKKSRLEIHMRIHSDTRPYECTEPGCGKRFHTSGNLRKHTFVHTGDKPHLCPVCGKAFSQATNLKLHLKTHQSAGAVEQDSASGTSHGSGVRSRKQEAVHRCEFCPMTFSRLRHFNAHRASHTGEHVILPCQLCDEQFSTINDLKRHKLEQHPGTVHQCPLCDKTFFKKAAMQKHLTLHDPNQAQAPKPVFPCRQCSSQFTTAAARTVHERSHTGERPFACSHCEKRFTSKYNFRQHLRMHSEDRPYKCDHCGKAFRQPQHLRAHSYTHKNQDEPVPCPICGKMFRNKILVMSHKRIHKQQAFKVAEEEQKQQQHEEAATDILMATQNQEQAGEATGLQFVDSMGFVNILVLTDQTEIQ